MTMQNGLKAGLIGAAVAVVLTLLGQIPLVGCCFSLLILVLWFGAGVLAGYFGNQANPMQTSGQAAQVGAVAGAITALGGGLVWTLISVFDVTTGRAAQAFSQLPPETLQQLRQLGVDARTFMQSGPIFILTAIGCCCILGPLFAALLGAAGGALTPSFFKRNP